MPWRPNEAGEMVWVDDPAPNAVLPPGQGSTINASLENQTPANERRVQLVNSATGDIVEVGESGVKTALDTGRFSVAAPEQIEAYDRRVRDGSFGAVKAGLEAAAAGGYDAFFAAPKAVTALGTALGILEEDPLADLQGRSIVSDAAHTLGIKDYDAAARQRAEEHGFASFAGNLAGNVAGGLGVGALARGVGGAVARATGSRVLAGGATAAIEGGILGGAQASEQAYLQDTELTSEQLLAGMGWGALMGGGVGLSAGAAGKLLFGRSGSRGATPLDSPRLNPGPRADDALEATAGRVLGDGVQPAPGLAKHLRDAFETGQTAVSGAPKEALEEVGALRGFLDKGSSSYRKRNLWQNRAQIWDDSAARLTKSLEAAADDADDVFDNVVDSGLKRSHISGKLTGDKSRMTQVGWEELSRVKDELRAAAERVDDFGNSALMQRRLKLLDSLEPKSADAADAFISLDKTKRALQQDVKALRVSATRQQDAYTKMQAQQLADYLDNIQERVRTGLEDASVWGEAGNAQKAINAKWGEYLRTQQTFRDAFLKRVDTDYATGRPIYRVDSDKVANYVRRTGRQEGKLVDEYFRRHVDAREALAKEIGDAFETGGEQVQRLSESSKAIRSTLGELDETARAVNQVEAIMEAEGTSGATGFGAILGGVLGGAPGAMLGGTVGALARPGTMIRQAAAIEQLARNLDGKITKSLSTFFERATKPVTLPGGAAKVAARLAPVAGTVSAIELFRGKEKDNQKAYRKRAQEVLDATENMGTRVRARAEEALGELPSQMPQLAGSVVTAATRGAEFLRSKLPAPLVNTRSLTPMSRPPVVSDMEINKFARYWSAVSNPLSVLDDLKKGSVTSEQVEALRVVYPRLFEGVQTKVREQLMTLDERGTLIPYQARLQLDLLLDLNGAGEPTATVEFMTRFAEYRAQAPSAAQQSQPQPPARPVQVSSRLRAGSHELDPTGKS